MNDSTKYTSFAEFPTEMVNKQTGEVSAIDWRGKRQKTPAEKKAEAEQRKLAKLLKAKEINPYVQWSSFNYSKDGMYLAMWRDERVSKIMRDVWHAYASFIGIGNVVCVQQKIVSERCQINSANISRITKSLVDCGYLLRNKQSNCLYSIPKEMAYCGSWRLYSEVQANDKPEETKEAK